MNSTLESVMLVVCWVGYWVVGLLLALIFPAVIVSGVLDWPHDGNPMVFWGSLAASVLGVWMIHMRLLDMYGRR